MNTMATYVGQSDLATTSWEIRSQLWPLLMCVEHEKAHIMAQLDKLVDILLKVYPTFNTIYIP